MKPVRIWDLPTRLFHWLFATACVIAWLSGDKPRYTDLHIFAGYLAVALALFRLLWGIVGGRYARFRQFVRGPREVLFHLRQLPQVKPHYEPGHNPAGAWAIVVLLGLVLLLGPTGLVVLGGEEGFGPLAGMFTIDQGVTVHQWHDWLAWALLAAVGAHLSGVLLESLLQRQNLPRSMVTGLKLARDDEAEPRNFPVVGLGMLLAVGLFASVWFFPYLQHSEEQPHLPFSSAALPHHAQWQTNCAECHMAYHPSLLPQRSWQRILDEQNDHFGEDLLLEPTTLTVLREYVRDNSAEQVQREVSWRTLRSLAVHDAPTRITDTPYWKQAHRRIDEAMWVHASVNGKFNCASCHRDAKQGGFMNGAMRLPN